MATRDLRPLDPLCLLVDLKTGELPLLDRLPYRDLSPEIRCVSRIASAGRRVLGKAARPLRDVVSEESREIRAAGQRERQKNRPSGRNSRAQHPLR